MGEVVLCLTGKVSTNWKVRMLFGAVSVNVVLSPGDITKIYNEGFKVLDRSGSKVRSTEYFYN